MLGCVRQTHDYSISMSLPGNVTATLSITDVSAAYSQLLQTLAHSEDPDRSEVRYLSCFPSQLNTIYYYSVTNRTCKQLTLKGIAIKIRHRLICTCIRPTLEDRMVRKDQLSILKDLLLKTYAE